MSYNKIILVGNCTKDGELKYSASGMGIYNNSIATSHKFTSNGEKKEEILFVDFTAFARTSEICNQYLRKGSQILVEGRLKFDQWVDQNGQKRSKHSVVVETMKMMDSKSDSQGQQAPQQQAQSYQQPQQQAQQQKPTDYQPQNMQQPQQRPSANTIPHIDIDEDEIPF